MPHLSQPRNGNKHAPLPQRTNRAGAAVDELRVLVVAVIKTGGEVEGPDRDQAAVLGVPRAGADQSEILEV